MTTTLRYLALLLAAILLSACGDLGITGCPFCDEGGSPAPPSPPTHYEVIGYPRAWIDGSATNGSAGYRLTMHVGDTTTLYVVTAASFPQGPFDTLRTVHWTVDSLGNSTAARITVRADGGGKLMAIAPGSVSVRDGSFDGRGAACDVKDIGYDATSSVRIGWCGEG